MTDDIVTRLREAATSNAGEYQLTMAPKLCLAIADEIERLREVVHGYRMCAFELYSGIHGDSQFAKAGEGVRISAVTAKAMEEWLQYDHVHWKDDSLHEK